MLLPSKNTSSLLYNMNQLQQPTSITIETSKAYDLSGSSINGHDFNFGKEESYARESMMQERREKGLRETTHSPNTNEKIFLEQDIDEVLDCPQFCNINKLYLFFKSFRLCTSFNAYKRGNLGNSKSYNCTMHKKCMYN